MKKCLVIIPTYNEAQNIYEITSEVFEVAKTLKSRRLEILIVDDNSPDGTAKIVRKIQAKNKKLHLITGQKEGLGRAYLRGFSYGLRDTQYDTFIMMDADFSHDPKAIPSLIKAIDDGADYASGSRYVIGGEIAGDWPQIRKHSSLFANRFARLVTGNSDVADLTGGFKAIRRSALEQIDLKSIKATGYVFLVNLLHEFSKKDFKITEVPITFTNRRHGSSKLRVYDILEFLYLTYRLNPNSRPRRFVRFGLVGFSGTIVNLAVLSFLVRVEHMSVILSGAIAIETSIVSNFIFNHLYTFRAAYTSPRTRRRDRLGSMFLKLIKYNLVSMGGAAISFSVFTIGYKQFEIPYLLSSVIGIIVALGWNYWLSANFIWKVVDA